MEEREKSWSLMQPCGLLGFRFPHGVALVNRRRTGRRGVRRFGSRTKHHA
jgi:hypothetical protein